MKYYFSLDKTPSCTVLFLIACIISCLLLNTDSAIKIFFSCYTKGKSFILLPQEA